MKGTERNKPCRCGSGKKYKRCCWYKADDERRVEDTVAEARFDREQRKRKARVALGLAAAMAFK